METDNTVSIWIGNFKNLTELENYIDLTYDDEGEIVVSDFFNDFKIDINDIDEDLIEKAVLPNETNDISIILRTAYYEEQLLCELNALESLTINKGNTVVLIYNYAYDGSVKSSDYLNFITSVDYR